MTDRPGKSGVLSYFGRLLGRRSAEAERAAAHTADDAARAGTQAGRVDPHMGQTQHIDDGIPSPINFSIPGSATPNRVSYGPVWDSPRPVLKTHDARTTAPRSGSTPQSVPAQNGNGNGNVNVTVHLPQGAAASPAVSGTVEGAKKGADAASKGGIISKIESGWATTVKWGKRAAFTGAALIIGGTAAKTFFPDTWVGEASSKIGSGALSYFTNKPQAMGEQARSDANQQGVYADLTGPLPAAKASASAASAPATPTRSQETLADISQYYNDIGNGLRLPQAQVACVQEKTAKAAAESFKSHDFTVDPNRYGQWAESFREASVHGTSNCEVAAEDRQKIDRATSILIEQLKP